ncbi:MAG TPA: glycosyltransferase family A protein [Pyrinomonadaceae bacterium]|nr:glycosyltransferase family A protein [Pyrinomonadaceae bacterium]
MIQAEISPLEIPPTETPRPAVSVIIPAYNVSKYIGEALNSVFDQTFTSHESIVINDGSADTEELERVLEPYAARIRYIKQENLGAAAARNAGLRCAQGEFVAFLDADDTWSPDFLEQQIDFLKSRNADVVYADALLFGDSSLAGRTFMELQPSRGEVTSESLLAVEVTVLTSAVLARKDAVFAVGLFDEEIKRGHDFDLWLRLAKNGARFAYQAKVLAQHRIVESGLSGNMMSQLERTLSVLETIKTRGKLTPGEDVAFRINLNRTLAELALENGKEKLLNRDFDGALQHFKEAKNLRHGWKLVLVCFGLRVAPRMVRRIYSRRNGASKGG